MAMLWLILPLVVAEERLCQALHDKYVGFPECPGRMDWLFHNWETSEYRQIYEDGGIVADDWCSVQNFLAFEEGGGGTIEHHCPDPNWVDRTMERTVNDDGSETFLVYRALKAFRADGTTDQWATKLLNSNAASLGGVLSYIHTEVVPEDMREPEDKAACLRKWGYDSIMVFNVTIKTPPIFKDTYGDLMGPFSAFDRGQCTGGSNVCDFNALGGYAPGRQEQTGNPRHGYPNAWWYSFPQCGHCDWPTGDPHCTYTYNVVGRYDLDLLAFPQRCENCPGMSAGPCRDGAGACQWWDHAQAEEQQCAPGLTECPQYNFTTWCQRGMPEYERHRATATDDCRHDGQYKNTINGSDFWYYVCDMRMCLDRMQRMSLLEIDTSFAGPGSPPFEGMCLAGYTRTSPPYWDPDFANDEVSSVATLAECQALCEASSEVCLAFGYDADTGLCRVYIELRSPTGAPPPDYPFYLRNHPPSPTPWPTPSPTPEPTNTPTPPPTTKTPTPRGYTYPPSHAPTTPPYLPTSPPSAEAPTAADEGSSGAPTSEGNSSTVNSPTPDGKSAAAGSTKPAPVSAGAVVAIVCVVLVIGGLGAFFLYRWYSNRMSNYYKDSLLGAHDDSEGYEPPVAMTGI